MKTRLLSLALAVTLALTALTGCVGPFSGGAQSRKIGISMPNDSNAQWTADSEIMHDILVQAGYEVNIQFAGGDAAAQLQQIQDMVGAGCSTIIVAAVEPDLLSGTDELGNAPHQSIHGGGSGEGTVPEPADLAHAPVEDGVNLIAYDTFLTDTSIVDYYVGFDGFEAGYLQASYLVSSLSLAEGAVGRTLELFFGDPADLLTEFQLMGAMEVLQPYLDSGALVIRSGETALEDCAMDSAQATLSRMEKLLSSTYADGRLDAVLCGNDAVALTVSEALFDGFTGGAYPILTGQGCLEDSVNALTTGRQAMTLLRDCTGMAQEAARVAMSLAAGEAVETGDRLDNGRVLVPASLFYPEVVDRFNLREMLVERGYFTGNGDGTYSAAASYTSGYPGLLEPSGGSSGGDGSDETEDSQS